MLTGPLNLLVLLLVGAMAAASWRWLRLGQGYLDQLVGALKVLRGLGFELSADHPVRRRLESASVAELALEEIVRLMRDDHAAPAAQGLLRLEHRAGWIERFAQFSVHLGILGTVLALMLVDSAEIDTFRQQLPLALGTTFWGLLGALVMGAIGGAVDSVLDGAREALRLAVLDSVDGGAPAATAASAEARSE
jgi:hypothetical protein